jgi:hypothetical protein
MKAHELQSDGSYRRLTPKKGEPAHRSQMEFIALATGTHRPDIPVPDGEPKYSQVRVATRPAVVEEATKLPDRKDIDASASGSRTATESRST